MQLLRHLLLPLRLPLAGKAQQRTVGEGRVHRVAASRSCESPYRAAAGVAPALTTVGIKLDEQTGSIARNEASAVGGHRQGEGGYGSGVVKTLVQRHPRPAPLHPI